MKVIPNFILLCMVTLMVMPFSICLAGMNNKPFKNKLLIFTGSDWCPNCRRLEKKILDDSVFISFVTDMITIEFADFPQHKKLENTVVEKNRALAEKYHFQGVYPTILLLDSAGNIRSEIFYRNQNAAEIIDQLKLLLKQ